MYHVPFSCCLRVYAGMPKPLERLENCAPVRAAGILRRMPEGPPVQSFYVAFARRQKRVDDFGLSWRLAQASTQINLSQTEFMSVTSDKSDNTNNKRRPTNGRLRNNFLLIETILIRAFSLINR